MTSQSTLRQVYAGAKMMAVAGVVALGLASAAPAHAITFTGSLATGGDPAWDDPIDLLDLNQVPGSFNASFTDSTGAELDGDTWTFNFLNSSGSSMVLSVITGTLQQLGTDYFWTDGATVTFPDNADVVAAQGQGEVGFELDTLVAPGDTVSLVFTYGDVVLAQSGAGPDFDFGVTASVVPLPAGFVLFLTGLAGIGFLGRYKAKRRVPELA